MHLSSLVKSIRPAFSGEAAKRYTGEIARFHRIQATPGYRAAAQWLLETLQAQGVEAWIERFPASVGVRFWALPSFQEWDCREATLDWLQEDGVTRLCDLRASAVSVVQRSMAVEGEFEVVDVGAGTPADYEGVEVAGKLVLSRSPVRATYQRAVLERGAAGVLFDDITGKAPGRTRTDLPDARQYASFWWLGQEPKAWGFVLTPRQGDALRAALRAGQQVRVRAHIDAQFYDGEIETVVARIPGQAEGGVLGMAHLCHPQGFANDNASGAACLLETVLTLHRLIANESLASPRRSLYFLWIPEMTGTYAWLQAHEDLIPELVAGINLDMVGESQEATGSVLVLERPPEALSSFAPDLLECLRRELLAEQPTLGNTELYPLIRFVTTGFSGGSDHMITSDPAVGIPTPMLIQWPDRYYHTTADTLDKVDPVSLEQAGTLAAGYLYWLARAQSEEARWLGWEMVARFEQRLSREVQQALTEMWDKAPEERAQAWQALAERIAYRLERTQEGLRTVERLGDIQDVLSQWLAEVEEIATHILERSRRQVRPGALPDASALPQRAPELSPSLIPVRLHRGPIMDLAAPQPIFELSPEDAQTWRQLYDATSNWRLLRTLAEYWTDGQRSLAEIERLVRLECGQSLGAALETYFKLLARVGVLEFREESSRDADEENASN